MTTLGKVHSIESCGTVDGPGIRFVAFMQGCPLRCQYCHNPDTWDTKGGTTYTPEELFEKTIQYKNYMKFSEGGVTITGGEPLLQANFILEYFKLCRSKDIHTAIDTSGFILNDTVKELLQYTNLVLLDIKNFDPKVYKAVTGVELKPTLTFLDYLKEINTPTIIRYVVVPDLTDNLDSIKLLSNHLNDFSNLLQIEILPFHKMGEYKWENLQQEYLLHDTDEPTETLIEQVKDIFSSNNKKVL